MAETRGSWTIAEGIARRWSAKGLDATFRSYWSDPASFDQPVLHDTEARPAPRGPYCTFEQQEPVPIENHNGTTSTTYRKIMMVAVQFEIHAKTSGSSTGKAIARDLAKEVAAAFDPGAGRLDISPDEHITTVRGPDFPIREGDTEWKWVLVFEITVDATLDLIA